MEFLQAYFTEPDTLSFWDYDLLLSNNLIPNERVMHWKSVFQQDIRSEFEQVTQEYDEFCREFDLNTKLYYQVALTRDREIDYEYDYLDDIKSNWEGFYAYIAGASDWRHTGQGPETYLSIPFVTYHDEQITIPGSNNHAYYRNLSIDQIIPFENEHGLPLYQLSFEEDDIVANESGMCHSTFVFYGIKLMDVITP